MPGLLVFPQENSEMAGTRGYIHDLQYLCHLQYKAKENMAATLSQKLNLDAKIQVLWGFWAQLVETSKYSKKQSSTRTKKSPKPLMQMVFVDTQGHAKHIKPGCAKHLPKKVGRPRIGVKRRVYKPLADEAVTFFVNEEQGSGAKNPRNVLRGFWA